MQSNTPFDHEVDVLIIGSGAGAMTAALVANMEGCEQVLVVEKGNRYGGTSAMSGGALWIPNSHLARAIEANDSIEEALEHLRTVVGGEVAESKLRAYVERAPEMLRYMMEKTRLNYELMADSDYYPELPGGKRDHRVVQPKPMHGRHLKKHFNELHEQPPQVMVMGLLPMTLTEAHAMMKRSSGWIWIGMRVVLRYLLDIPGRLKGMRSRCLTMGNALVGQLRHSMLERNIELWLKSPMTALLEENGNVIGAVVEKEGQVMHIHARKGVVIGAGGFEHNKQMREEWLPKPTNSRWSASQTNNTGDGIQAAVAIGAKTDLMEHAWWAPAIPVPGKERPYAIFTERNLPGMVIVNKAGKRFENEAAPYHDGVVSMYRANSPHEPAIPAYVIFDLCFRIKYPFGPVMPGYMLPDFLLPGAVRDVLVKANSLEELAEKLDIDADNLQETIEKNNAYARGSRDPEFHRGDSYYDRFNSDHRAHPNPCIAKIGKPPFYALPLQPGDLGTKGGILTDEYARALNENGEVIHGLYVIGNSAASVMGSKDPGSGATLGPAMTFGYVAAKHIVQR